jgi:hypothetical protein
MKFRKIGAAIATIAALAPAICCASTEKAALDACARAFASSLASPGAAAPSFKVAYHGVLFAESAIDLYGRGYSFHLYAHNLKTGLAIAQASCSTDYHGAVVAFAPIPLGAAAPRAFGGEY